MRQVDAYRCQQCNVVYIDVLNLRPDHMGVYGYHRNTTPTIDRLAEEAIVFEEAYAQEVHTVRSVYSTFTGLYPSQHRITRKLVNDETLPGDVVMAHRTAGMDRYLSVAAASQGTLTGPRFRSGFDAVVRDNISRIVTLLNERDDRFFLYYQNDALHKPVYPPPEYSKIFSDTNTSLRRYLRSILRRSSPNSSVTERYRARLGPGQNPRYEQAYLGRAASSLDGRQHLVSEYDGAVRWVDDRIGELLDALADEEMLEDTIIVVGAPHAIPLGAGGRVLRDGTYREDVHVPLIIRLPGLERKRRVAAPVQNIDLWPTLLDMLGVRHRSFETQSKGVSLLPLLRDGRRPRSFILTETPGGVIAMTNLWTGRRYVRVPHGRDRVVVNWSRPPGERQLIREGDAFRTSHQWFQDTYREVMGRSPFTPPAEETYPYWAK